MAQQGYFLKPVIAAIAVAGLAALGGGLTVFSAYDDSPGGQLLGVLMVLVAMALAARTARGG